MNRNPFVVACLLALMSSFFVRSGLAAPQTEQVKLDGHQFTVEIANNNAKREHGLMFRVHMAADHGMLFVYSGAQPRAFWMKNTLIPLDIIFFDARKRLINVSADTPPCKTPECPSYMSSAPAQYVLELNAGMAAKLGLKPGDRFTVR